MISEEGRGKKRAGRRESKRPKFACGAKPATGQQRSGVHQHHDDEGVHNSHQGRREGVDDGA